MGIYIPGMELPDKDHLVLVEIDSNGDIFAAYDGGRTKLVQYKAVPVPEFSDISSDPDDVWKKIFTLVVLLLSDKEKFDKLKDDMLADMEE